MRNDRGSLLFGISPDGIPICGIYIVAMNKDHWDVIPFRERSYTTPATETKTPFRVG